MSMELVAGAVIRQTPILESNSISVRRQRISKISNGSRYESVRTITIYKKPEANKEWLK